MNYANCKLYPEASIPDGVDAQGNPKFRYEDSMLYKKLLKRFNNNRPLVNYLYTKYKASDLADQMDQANIPRNSQYEHNAEDILRFIDWTKIETQITNLSSIERSAGFTDINGQRVDFTDAKDALQRANDFNNNYEGLVATVVQHGDIYNIITSQKDSRTHTYGDSVSECLKIWDVYEQIFNAQGIDINAMPQELNSRFNALNTDLAQSLKNLQNMSIDNMYKLDAWTLFALSPNSHHVQNVINAFGSIEAAAQAINDINHGATNYTSAQKTLLRRAINDAKTYQGIDIDALITQVKQMSQNVHNMSPEEDIKNELHKLNKKYHIDVNEIHRTSDKIKTLSEAVAESVITLQRQIRQVEKERGNNAEGRRLENIYNSLMTELNAKKYYSGILNFLNEATSQVSQIDTMLQNIPQTGTEIEKAFATAKILQDIKSLKTQYYSLVSALSNDNLIVDESISQNDIDNFRQSAKDLKDFFDKKDNMIDNLTESTMINLMTQIVGNTAPDGQSIINAVRMAATDSTKFDYLYSIGRASNPIVASVGSIIRNAQDTRDAKMNNISLRIRKITDRLYKSGLNSEYIYEDDGHIVSDIDWNAYTLARDAKIKALKRQGLRNFDLKQAIEDWEDQNTEDRVVDHNNGRTEKVPNYLYRKQNNFQDGWSQEQIDYYNDMMQLKGEIGSMLPAYAQHQYLPPQVRRKFLDALNDANNFSDVAKAVKNKAQNFYKVREDDENYNMNGIIDGQEFAITESDFDNTPLRQIPIFFVNKVEQGELLHNFSTGIAALAGTAVNYEAMHEIVDTVEFMGDFVKSQNARGNISKGDIAETKMVRVVKDVWKKGTNTNTADLINGFISQHIYGQHRSEFENEHKLLSKVFNNILAYTSFKGLATNIKGAFANYIMGEFQMLIEAGAGEFYGFKDFAWAHSKLFGGSGVGGEIAELLTNNVNHKGVLLGEMFDPLQENFSNKSHKNYYKTMFRQLVSHDCSFLGYSSGEYLIHYVNMYGILHNQKVLLNGEKISLYDAFEVTNKQDGNSELRLKQGVTDLNGNAITNDFIDKIRKRIRYANQTTHGSMNAEDKGLIHQRWWGRGIMNFRQWTVEHYSRRFRGRHFDATLGETREGYWQSLVTDNTRELWNDKKKKDAIMQFMRDMYTFTFRAQSQWSNLNDMQKHNVRRVQSEMLMYVALLGLSFALGEPDDHKQEFWRRWWIYQTRRMILDTEASMPHIKNFSNWMTVMNAPMASINTMNSLLYMFYGLTNGDLFEEIQSGDHAGENKYLRNVIKYDLPFFKDWEQMQNMDTDDAIFTIFDTSPSNH